MKKNRGNLNFLPISINITDKKILIVGGGKVAYNKAISLTRFTENVTVVSPEFHHGFDGLSFTLEKKEYEPSDLDGVFLAYLCTNNESLNAQIKLTCQARGILTSVCDNPNLCDFISPAIYKDENVTISVNSNAKDVHQSVAIRNQIKSMVDDGKLRIR